MIKNSLTIMVLGLFLFISQTSIAAETMLHCKFKYGDRTILGKTQDYGPGDIEDEYLKIDFDKEKIISVPHYTRGYFGIDGFGRDSVLFKDVELVWYGKKKDVYSYHASLNRQTGKLKILYNQSSSKPERESTEYNYSCSRTKLKF